MHVVRRQRHLAAAGGKERWTADEMNDKAMLYRAERGVSVPWAPLTDDDLARVRGAASALVASWRALQPGEALELPFGTPGPSR